MYSNFHVGVITALSELKPPLRRCTVDVGRSEPISVVTNASNVREGSRVVVACVGAVVPAGADPDSGTLIARTTVGGAPSEGMLCDAPMLGWGAANANAAVRVPDSFAVGSEPPASKPRGDGGGAPAEEAAPASSEPGLFEKKLTKEEKKAAAAAKREAKKAAKAAAAS